MNTTNAKPQRAKRNRRDGNWSPNSVSSGHQRDWSRKQYISDARFEVRNDITLVLVAGRIFKTLPCRSHIRALEIRRTFFDGGSGKSEDLRPAAARTLAAHLEKLAEEKRLPADAG